MSLINDALRRASQQRRRQPPKPSVPPPLQPVEHRRRPNPWPWIIMLPTVFILLGLAGFFFWAFTEYRRVTATPAAGTAAHESRGELSASIPGRETNLVARQPLMTPLPLALTTAPATNEAPAASPSSVANVPAASNIAAQTGTSAPLAVETKTNLQAETAVSPPAPPPLKLQGIYYSRSNPSALINGKSVFVGETIGGARVLSIERESVTLEQGGQTNVLRVP
jgi:hypothetical protein